MSNEKFRQGQTIHIVSVDYSFPIPKPRISTYFMYSHKEPLPPEYHIIERMPVSRMNKIVKQFGYGFRTHSRRKAVTRLKQLELQYAKR